MNNAKSLLVSFVVNEAGTPLMVIGTKKPNQSVEVINAFTGPEAEELWNKLITKKEKE